MSLRRKAKAFCLYSGSFWVSTMVILKRLGSSSGTPSIFTFLQREETNLRLSIYIFPVADPEDSTKSRTASTCFSTSSWSCVRLFRER
ncbi:MAG: hypothetical protein BWY96_00120 [Spirochaetes bacterium ADurb.BinA120]|nr:MAG: hypothetical protein BWY96_00120 [Spirochaetes bacterium ADurb.BinA120]